MKSSFLEKYLTTLVSSTKRANNHEASLSWDTDFIGFVNNKRYSSKEEETLFSKNSPQ